jgi:hypothetical protein
LKKKSKKEDIMKLRFGFALIILILIIGCKSKTHFSYFSIPKIDDVVSIAYHVSELNIDNDPKPLTPNNEHDRKIINKLIGFLEMAKEEGYEDKLPMPSIIIHYATIFLKNGFSYNITPGANSVVYVSDKTNNKTTRIVSYELNNWLFNGWENDLN